jgi:predicted lipoprotein with Yx(FWY)xxD motif
MPVDQVGQLTDIYLESSSTYHLAHCRILPACRHHARVTFRPKSVDGRGYREVEEEPVMRSLIAVLAVLLAACSTAAPGATPALTPVPTVAVTPAPATPAATPVEATPAPATPAPAITPGPTYPCDPAYDDCEPKYTPRPTAATTPEPVGEQVLVNLSADGTYLVDEAGMSLYTFDRDSANVSACTSSDCLDNWPPLILPPEVPAVAGEGVTGDVSGFDRSDGPTQVAYNGQPLYHFISDEAPGDTRGDGVNDTWHLARP